MGTSLRLTLASPRHMAYCSCRHAVSPLKIWTALGRHALRFFVRYWGRDDFLPSPRRHPTADIYSAVYDLQGQYSTDCNLHKFLWHGCLPSQFLNSESSRYGPTFRSKAVSRRIAARVALFCTWADTDPLFWPSLQLTWPRYTLILRRWIEKDVRSPVNANCLLWLACALCSVYHCCGNWNWRTTKSNTFWPSSFCAFFSMLSLIRPRLRFRTRFPSRSFADDQAGPVCCFSILVAL